MLLRNDPVVALFHILMVEMTDKPVSVRGFTPRLRHISRHYVRKLLSLPTHAEPTYIIDDVVHYCVANMPGGVPRTSTLALNNATLPFLRKIANDGYKQAMAKDKNLLAGLNVCKGSVTYEAVANSFKLPFVSPKKFI